MQTYSLAALATPPPSATEDGYTEVQALNFDAQVAGNAANEAALWDDGTLRQLRTPGTGSFATDISADGTICGLHHWSYPTRAFVAQAGQFTDLTPVLAGPGSCAAAVSNSGLVVGWAGTVSSYRPFVYEIASGQVTMLDPMPGHAMAAAHAVNDSGQVAGLSGDGDDERLFFYRDGATTDAGTADWVTGLNNAGVAVGSRVFPGATNWTAYRIDLTNGGRFEDLGHSPLPGTTGSHGNGINNFGVVVGNSFGWGGEPSRAFVHYPPGHPEAGFHDLAPRVEGADGWELERAVDINDRGIIIGNGRYHGQQRSFVLHPHQQRSRFEIDGMLTFVKLFDPGSAKRSNGEPRVNLG